MSRVDRPDGVAPITPVTVQVDGTLVAEILADRLGRLYTIPQLVEPVDHRGHVVWYDRFAYDPIRYAVASDGASGSATRSEVYAYDDSSSLALTAGPNEGDYTRIYRGLPELAACTLGLEIRSMYPSGVPASLARELFIHYYTGSLLHTFGWRYRDEGAPGVDVYYGSAWHLVAAVAAPTDGAIWNALKVAVNLDDPAYIRGILDSREYDLSAHTVDSAVDATARGIIIEVRNTLLSDGDDTVYLGRLVITDREPVS